MSYNGSVVPVQTSPIAGGTNVTNIFNYAFTSDLGTVVTLNGLTATQAITGLLTTDQCILTCLSGLPTGVAIGNVRCSVNGTLSVRFVTGVIGNVALGSLNYLLTVFR